jgi:hypothetical protein
VRRVFDAKTLSNSLPIAEEVEELEVKPSHKVHAALFFLFFLLLFFICGTS